MRHETPSREASETREKILIFSPFPALPADQGNRARLFWLCELLRDRGFALHFMLHMRENGGRVDSEMLERHTRYFDAFYYLPFTSADQPVQGKHCDPDVIWDKGIEPALDSILQDVDYQAAIINYAPFARVARWLPPQTLTFLDSHDRMGGRREKLEEAGIKPSFYFFTDEEEKKMCSNVDFVIAIKEAERLHFEGLLDRKALTLGTVPRQQRIASSETGAIVNFAFLGSLNSVNERAVEQLQTLLSERVSDFAGRAKFSIFGKVASLVDPSSLACRAQILDPVGFIQSVDDMYAASDVVIVPTERSTGLKIKTVEALQTGVAVISTEDGFDGVPSDHAFHNCTDIAEVLDRCEAVCRGRLKIDRLRTASRQVADTYQQSFDRALGALCTAISRPAMRILLRLGETSLQEPARDLAAAATCITAFASYFRIEIADVDEGLSAAELTALRSLGADTETGSPDAPVLNAFIGSWTAADIAQTPKASASAGRIIDLDGMTRLLESSAPADFDLLERNTFAKVLQNALRSEETFTIHTSRDALSTGAPAQMSQPGDTRGVALTVPIVAMAAVTDWTERRHFVINAIGHGREKVADLLSLLMSLYGEGVFLPPIIIVSDSEGDEGFQGLPISVTMQSPREMALMLLKRQWFVNVDLTADGAGSEAADLCAYASSSAYSINFVDRMYKVARAQSIAGGDAQISFASDWSKLILAALAAHGRPGFEHINTTRRRPMPPYGDLPSILRRGVAAHVIADVAES